MLLQNLQAEFADSIATDQEEATWLVKSAQPIQIYRHNILATLTRTLRQVYPLIAKLVGDDFFHIAAKEYIKRYPSRSSNLHDYGEYFSDFLIEYQPVKTLVYLADVAKFEWACHTLYFAADHVSLDSKKIELLSSQQHHQLHLILHPASRVIKFYHPILHIIALCQDEIDETINLHEGGVSLLIARPHFDMVLTTLTESEYVFFQAIYEGETLAVALEKAILVDARFNFKEKLPFWIENKTIVDYILDS